MMRLVKLFLSAVAFLTRLPVPPGMQGAPGVLASATAFFPLVGLLVSAGAILLHHLLSRLVAYDVVVMIVLVYLVAVTGGLHEDALADTADGLGGGWDKDQVLAIMRDSRVGSFGVLAIALALLARFVLLSNIPPPRLDRYLVSGLVACRWTALPLAFFLPAAREEGGQGARIAGQITAFSLVMGTLLTLAIVGVALGRKAWWVMLAASVITGASGAYYRRRIGGVTGDCLGATNQLAEVAVYFAAVVLH
jgi:adenosylcobinamide-GDP ribazoletransferase